MSVILRCKNFGHVRKHFLILNMLIGFLNMFMGLLCIQMSMLNYHFLIQHALQKWHVIFMQKDCIKTQMYL